MPKSKHRRPSLPVDLERDEALPEPTALPNERLGLDEGEEDRVVPPANVGGAAPSMMGGDSGGDFPGPDDDLSNLAEPEPPEDSPEIGAMHVQGRVPSSRGGPARR